MKFHLPGLIIALALSIQDSNGQSFTCEAGQPQQRYIYDLSKEMPPAFPKTNSTTTLSVVLWSARHAKRTRQLAIIIRNYTQEQIENGTLIVYQPFPEDVMTLPIKNNIRKQTNHSLLILTGKHACEVQWAHYSTIFIQNTFFVVHLRVNSKLVTTGSLDRHLKWMGANRKLIGSLKLSELAIPGTINSAIYSPYGEKNYSNIFQEDSTFSQEEDIFTQLVYGVRAFHIDLEFVEVQLTRTFKHYEFYVKGKNRTDAWKIEEVLKPVQRFLHGFPEEVVFIDLRFENATGKSLTHLHSSVGFVLGKLLYMRGPEALRDLMDQTLDKLVARRQRAIVTYSDNQLLRNDLFPEIRRIEVNTDKIHDLKTTLIKKMSEYKKDKEWFYNAYVQLLSSPSNPKTKRALATQINLKAGEWCFFNRDFNENINMISVEYFANSDIVSCCVATNLRRAEALRPKQQSAAQNEI